MFNPVVYHGLVFLCSLLLCYYLIPLVVQLACRLHILDLPDGNIKVHEKPVPYLGGLAVYLAFIETLALFYPFNNHILWLLLGSTLLLFVGLIDDLAVLKPGQKFLGQMMATVCFLKGGFWLKSIFFSSNLNLFFSGFWILSIINAFNLIDVMDGLSSLVALTVAGSFFVMAIFFQQYDISLLLLAFMGALCAFFLYNKPPANIYLGDAGALFVGGFLSVIPFLLPWSSQSFEAYYASVIIFAVPLLELFFLVIIRTWLGIPFYRGSPHHFAIYLQKKGWTKKQVLGFVLFVGCYALVAAMAFLVGAITVLGLGILSIMLFCGWSVVVFSAVLTHKRPETVPESPNRYIYGATKHVEIVNFSAKKHR